MTAPNAVNGRPSAPRGRRMLQAKPSAGLDLLFCSIALLILTSVFRLQNLYPIFAKLQVPTLAAVGAYGLYLLDRDPKRRLKPLWGAPLAIALAIVFLIAISIPTAYYPGRSFSFLTKDHWKTIVLMILIAGAMRSVKDANRLAFISVVGAGLYSFVTLLRFSLGADGRLAYIYFYDANDLAFVLVLTIPFVVYMLRPGTPLWQRLVVIVASALIVLTIVRTGSRGGFLGLLAVGTFILLRYRAVPARWRVGVIMGIAVGIMAMGTAKYWELMQTILNPKQDYNYDGEGGRLKIWRRGMTYMISRPITGVGPANFGVAEGRSQRARELAAMGQGVKWLAPHNVFVQIGAELGIPGLLLLIALIAVWYRDGGKLAALRRPGASSDDISLAAFGQSLQASAIGYVVCGFFLSMAYSAYMYVLIGMLIGATKLARLQAAPVSAAAPAPPVRGRMSGVHAARARLRNA